MVRSMYRRVVGDGQGSYLRIGHQVAAGRASQVE